MFLRKTHLYSTSAILFFLSGCNGDTASSEGTFGGGEFQLVFQGKVGKEAFRCGEMYSNIGSSGVKAMAQDFRFYVSNIRLISKGGEEVPVEMEDEAPWQAPEVALIDFEDGSGPCSGSGSRETNTKIAVSVPEGQYTGIVFSTSVPEDLNHEDPTTNPAPLQVTAMQWSWLLGYKFIRAEMHPMMSGGDGGAGGSDGSSPGGHAMDSQFHMGSLACTNDGGPNSAPEGSCDKPNRNQIILEKFNPEKDLIVADLAEMMKGVDLEGMNHCHGAPSEACPPMYESVGIDYEKGDKLESQSAFRAEEL